MQRSVLAYASATILGVALCYGQNALAQTQMQGKTVGAPQTSGAPAPPAKLPDAKQKRAECTSQGESQGLKGKDLKKFVKECMKKKLASCPKKRSWQRNRPNDQLTTPDGRLLSCRRRRLAGLYRGCRGGRHGFRVVVLTAAIQLSVGFGAAWMPSNLSSSDPCLLRSADQPPAVRRL